MTTGDYDPNAYGQQPGFPPAASPAAVRTAPGRLSARRTRMASSRVTRPYRGRCPAVIPAVWDCGSPPA